ncbi:MAG: RtcB family protein [Candidatus Syntrophopropionicum ammoniitolerans]
MPRSYLTVMVHTGSRGFGHQICVDYSKILLAAAGEYGIEVPDRGLACAPIDSQEGKNYYAAMACAVNYAFANRHLITHEIRKAFVDVLGKGRYNLGINLVYDIAHNIAKWEEHGGQRLLIHRKGHTCLTLRPHGKPIYIQTYGSPGSNTGQHGHCFLRSHRHGKGCGVLFFR